jgi:hypothetical protein
MDIVYEKKNLALKVKKLDQVKYAENCKIF